MRSSYFPVRSQPSLIIFGTRGVPAAHGGFETFAEQLALFLVGRGWHVIVYCQTEVETVTQRVSVDRWRGIERRHVGVTSSGPRATLEFDWHCIRDAARLPGLCLVLGYNSALFLPYLRVRGRTILTNMDGIEWRRPKWGIGAKAWLWTNEWIAAWVSHRLIADHPTIADHLATRRPRAAITMIPYGGTPLGRPSEQPVRELGLQPGRYLIAVARIEPDNNILAIVEAFSRRHRGMKLVILGDLNPAKPYDVRIGQAASDEVIFPGSIYDSDVVAALRYHARCYLHGHMIGGTNPSLVAALWASNAVVAHDNAFNRWTAGNAALFFSTVEDCDLQIGRIIADDALVSAASKAALLRATEQFALTAVLEAYERLALTMLGAAVPSGRTELIRAEQPAPVRTAGTPELSRR